MFVWKFCGCAVRVDIIVLKLDYYTVPTLEPDFVAIAIMWCSSEPYCHDLCGTIPLLYSHS